MAYIPKLPVTIVGKIVGGSVTANTYYNNPSSLYNGYPYTYDVTIELVPVLNSDDRITPNAYTYDSNNIEVGMWIGQPNGLVYEIVSINTITSGSLIDVTIKDVNLFNILSDTTFSGGNAPLEDAYGLIFALSEDGNPILNGLELQRGNLPDINYWINDFYARFQYRNLISTYYNNDPSNLAYGTGYTVGQLVYLDSTGQFQIVDDTVQAELEKAFGVITSVNEPEDGNMTVRPFGKITGGLNLTSVGNIGDVLYYDMSASGTNYVTATKPLSNPLPVYIKISNTSAAFMGWPLTPGISGGTSGTSGESGSSGTSGETGTSGSSGESGSSGTSGETGTSGESGSSGTSGESGSSGTSGGDGTSGSSGSSGESGSSGSSGESGSSGSSGESGSSGSSGTSGESGTSGSSGTSGVDGTSGSSGTSGESGTSGSSGTSGESGTSGSSGTSGETGSSGTSGDSGPSGTSGESGTSGSSGTSGESGTSGSSGGDGISSTIFYYEAHTTATSGYPGDGHILWNNATQTSATEINISHLTDQPITDIDVFLALIKNGQDLIIQDQSNSNNYQTWKVNGTPTKTVGVNTYWTIPVTLVASGGVSQFTNNHPIILATVGINGATVTGATLNNTILELQNSDNTTIQVDFDPADDLQSKEGVTTHGFIFLDENSFTGDTFNNIFTTSSKTDSIQVKELQVTDFTAKLTYIVLDVVNTGSTENYIVVLPPFISLNDESRVIKFITKRNNLDNMNDLMVGSKWTSSGSQNRIIAANIKTKVTNDGYFFPLETLESIELLYDGFDWLVVNTQKQQYVQAQPVNYLLNGTNGTAGSYKNRDINNLL